MEQTKEQTLHKPLRLWPGVVAAALLCVLRYIVPFVVPDGSLIGLIGALVCAVAILIWWLFFSRAAWLERLGAVALMFVAIFATMPLLHKSIATGMMGRMFFVYAVPPTITPALVAWAVATRNVSNGVRRAWLVVALAAGCAVWTLFRTDGIMGAGAQIAWRWSKTYEERLLAQDRTEPKPAVAVSNTATSIDKPVAPAATSRADGAPRDSSAAAPPTESAAEPADAGVKSRDHVPSRATSSADVASVPVADATRVVTDSPTTRVGWPGFRGPRRDGVIAGVSIESDWSKAPPVEMWRRPVGPGWSSFAVHDGFIYTQEQRGEDEVVSSYKLSTGEPVWRHRDGVRFWESNGGAGPRATPTYDNGRIYTFGATGILNALDARSGRVVWTRNVATDIAKAVPMWGFASSPLVVGDLVIVAASGTLVAYDLASGNRRWSGPAHGGSYSSPHLSTIDGVTQVLLLSASGATSVAAESGALLWEYPWAGDVTIVQPAVISESDVLVTSAVATGGVGVRRLGIVHAGNDWSVEERWTSNGLKPYFNDFVVHKGYAFGFDGAILSCVDLNDGARKWKGGRYGNGQLVLLPEQDLLLVVSEEGDLALVRATPDQFSEVARFTALEGKTWNHPVLVGDELLVRNDHEMVAFRLTLANR